MDGPALRQLLDDVRSGACSPDDALTRLRRLPYADLGFARVDHHRPLRQGIPEAVYGPGKTPAQCAAVVVELLAEGTSPVVLTRADEAQLSAATAASLDAGHDAPTVGAAPAGLHTATWAPAPDRPGRVVVITAGTGDLPVAGECTTVLAASGFAPHLVADCGVAGVHRLLDSVDQLAGADVVVVVAGMEGALASLVGGITPAPVVAVPTSTGYGAAFEGVTALLAMLSSCASGITVVGIDNGYGAACAVARLLG
jgi:NCAIR mutase (PurE)-related protein